MFKIMLKDKNCALSIITIYIQICMNKYSGQFRKTVLLGCIYNTLYALLDNDCSIRVYQSLLQFFKFLLCLSCLMLTSCLMLNA